MSAGSGNDALTTTEFDALDTDRVLGDGADRFATRVPTCSATATAGELVAGLRGGDYESVDAVAVLDEDRRLLGLAPIGRVLTAASGAPLSTLMRTDAVTIDTGTPPEGIAEKIVSRDASVVAVLDAEGRFAGLLPPHRLVHLLIDAHHEDLARLGGFMHGSRQARRAAEERVSMRIWHRLPWLLLGLLGAMASVALVSSFEAQLDETVLIAFFLPAVVYMADAVGTQTEALMIRALAVGVSWRRVIRREIWSGIAIGVLIGALFIPFAAIGWGDRQVALAVGISLLAACSTATLAAMALPLLLQRLGLDPAFGAGPLATVIQDLASLAIYLGVTVAIIG